MKTCSKPLEPRTEEEVLWVSGWSLARSYMPNQVVYTWSYQSLYVPVNAPARSH